MGVSYWEGNGTELQEGKGVWVTGEVPITYWEGSVEELLGVEREWLSRMEFEWITVSEM